MSAITKESVMEMWDRLCAEKTAKEVAEAPLKKKIAKESKPKTACPHCGKQFISVNLHIAKTHQVNEIIRLKEGGIAVHINGVRVAYWLQHSKNRPKLNENDNGQWECCCGDKITYEDYTNGYKITEYLEGANKGKFEVHYMNKQRGIGCGNIVAFKNYTFRNE
jgi:hypothetical protein